MTCAICVSVFSRKSSVVGVTWWLRELAGVE